MKIAVSSNGNNLDSLIDPRVARCPHFLDPGCREMGGGKGRRISSDRNRV